MGLTERHWFENEDVPENYEWALEDAVYNSCTNKKANTVEVVRCKNDKEAIVNDLNVAKHMLCNRQILTPEMCVRIGQAITSVLTLLKEQEPVKPRYIPPKSIYSWECGVCAEPFDRIANYCPKCGRRVKWDD